MEKLKNKRIFIAPLNWGLGHATRVLPLIRRFLQRGDQVYIAAQGRALQLLQEEVPDCTYIDFPEYPIRYPRSRYFLTRFMAITFPRMLVAMWHEKRALRKLHKKYHFDYIISDNRFCLNLPEVKSYLISHQLRYKLPWPVSRMEWLPEFFNYFFFKKYNAILIPDLPDEQIPLTGELSHKMRYLTKENLVYSGVLADVSINRVQRQEDIDYFIIISGPEPQRSKLEKIIIDQIKDLKGKVIVAMGRPEKRYQIRMGNAIFYSYMSRSEMSDYLQRARFIIGRPGYTSVMEMVILGKKGLFVPTPGQIEQEYLARYYMEKGWCYCVPQNKFNLRTDEPVARRYPGFPKINEQVDVNVERLMKKYFA